MIVTYGKVYIYTTSLIVMPNPRYLTREGEPTVELLRKLTLAKHVFESNLIWFCEEQGLNLTELSVVERIYIIGSHANKNSWQDETSDLDLKIVNGKALPENLHRYKRKVLDRLLCQGERKRWIDIFFAREDYQVTEPRWDVTDYWKRISFD